MSWPYSIAGLLLVNPFTLTLVRIAWRDRVWLHRVVSDIIVMTWMDFRGTLTDERAEFIWNRLDKLERSEGKPWER